MFIQNSKNTTAIEQKIGIK